MRTFGGGAILSIVLVTLAIGAQACSPDPQPPGSTPNPSPSPLPPSRVFTTRDGVRFQVETVLTGLEIPWALAFAPDGRLFVTERPGRLRVVVDGRLQSEPIGTLPAYADGESGLMGLALDPAFADNGHLYVCYSTLPGASLINRALGRGQRINRLSRLTL